MSALAELKYAPYSEMDFFAGWCAENLRHSVDRFAGTPVVWEQWQRDWFEEVLACDEQAIPHWRNAALIVSRKNGKTLMLAALAVYRLIMDEDQPEVLLAAATDKQAGRLFEACVNFFRKNANLRSRVHTRESEGEIVNPDTGGKIIRLPSSGETLDGYNPSLAICDELHAWDTPTRRRVWTSLNTGDGARLRAQIVTITTSGDAHKRENGILGTMIDRNERAVDEQGGCERREGLTISRNHKARSIIYNYCAPTSNPREVGKMKLANPASWITEEFLMRKAENPELSDSEVLQLHGCVWADSIETWIDAGAWEKCRVSLEQAIIPDGSEVYVGIDVGITHDSSAVAVAWAHEDDHGNDIVTINATVWSAVPKVMAHVTVPGGVMDLSLLEEHVRYLGARYQIEEVAYDPRFFERSAQDLAEEYVTVSMTQTAAPMADAYQAFYQAVHEGQIRHNGDGVLRAHLAATAAVKTERGWKISKIRSNQRIDAVPAVAIAVYRAFSNIGGGGGVVYADEEAWN